MRWLTKLPFVTRPLRWLAVPLLSGAVLLTLGDAPGPKEAPWQEGDWTGTYAIARPSLPGQPAFLESSVPIPVDVRLRIYRVEDAKGFLTKTLGKGTEEGLVQGQRQGSDPLDLLREALLWGSRRAYNTVHRVATQSLRDAARESRRLREPLTEAAGIRGGQALPLEGRPGFKLVSEVVPEVLEPARREKDAGGFVQGDTEDLPGRVKLPGQAPGVYVIELLKEDQAAYVPWLVTDLALLSEQDGAKLRIQAVRATDGSALGGALEGLLFEGSRTKPLTFDAEGRCEVAATPGVLRTVMVVGGNNLALLRSEGIARAAVRQRLYAFTERPLYRPGQEVFVKAIVRKVNNGENEVAKGPESLPFKVLDPEDTEVAKGDAKLLSAETASYGATIQLPGAGRLGLHRVVFEGPEGPAQAEFKVEFFQKPAFAVSVSADVPKVGVGDPLKFQVKARYFYGAAVRNAKAQWFLYQVRPNLNRWWDENAGPAPELKESGEVDLDEEGQASLPELPAKEEGTWRMAVTVADASGQRNGGQAQIRCSTGDYILLLSPDRELVGPRQTFKATARVLDLEGKEVQGVPVTLKACAIRFTQRGKENNTTHKEDPWSWSFQHRPGEVFATGNGPTATLQFPRPGLHLLVAEVKDKAGRTVEAIRPMTVAEEGTPLPPVADLKAMPDKKEYRVGDTARILVRLPRPKLTLHGVVEGETLGKRFTRTVPGTSTIVEVPITREHQPNAWAVFDIVSDGVRQSVEVPLRVPRVDKKLTIAVKPDRDRYQPGGPMRVDVDVRDAEGKPTRADLAVGVVDEAIYALSAELHPDIFRFFHPSRRHLVNRAGSTEWSFWDVMRRQRPVWTLKQTKRGEFKNDEDRVRSVFKDTAHWVPFIAVGPDGKGSVSFTLPDNLTAWRTTATAVTADTKVGVAKESRPASKPLQVSLILPRTLSRGDVSRAIAMVRNLSGQPLSGKVRMEVQGATPDGPLEASFGPIPDQGEYRFTLPLKAEAVGKATVTCKVEGGALKDGERRSVEVVEPLIPASRSGFVVADGQTTTLPAPPSAKGKATVVFTPVAGLEQLMLPSLPYLIHFPYGCVEQTLSSFMPNLRVAALVKQGLMPPVDWKQLTDLDRNIRDGVFRVYSYQLPNGGWGWWSPKDFGPESNPHTTGYALQSFGAMQRLGYAVDEKVLRNGIRAAMSLHQQLAGWADSKNAPRNSPDPAADAAFVLLSLVRVNEPVAGMLDSTADKVLSGKWPGDHVLAITTLAAVEARHAKASVLLDRLEQAGKVRSGMVHWESLKDAWNSYAGGDIMPTVYALMALTQGRPQSPLIAQGEGFLSSQHQGYGWYSTWSTSQVLELIPLLAKVRTLTWDAPRMVVSVEGGPVFDFSTLKRDPLQRWNPRQPRPGAVNLEEARSVSFKAQGQGLLIWTYAYQVPGGSLPADAAAAASGLRLELRRKLWALRTPQQTGDARKGWVRIPWSGTLNVGDEAWMEVEFRANQYSQYAVLEVPIPAGLEPTVKLEGFVLEGRPFSDEDSADGWQKPRIEVHPDKVSFLLPSVGPWTQRVRLLLRAGMAGTYAMRPAKLSLMSNEAQWVTVTGLPVVVKEGGAK